MTDHGGAASPRTEAGKRLLGRLYRTDPANGAAGLSGEYLHGRLRLTEDILGIEAEAAQEAPAPEGLIERISTILDNARLAVVIEVGRAVVLDFGQAEAQAPEGLRLRDVRLLMIDGIGADLSREFAEGSPFEPFDRVYVVKTITRVLDAARDRTRSAAPPTPAEPPRPRKGERDGSATPADRKGKGRGWRLGTGAKYR